MKILAFMHIKLDVEDLEKSERFYRDELGLEERVRYPIARGTIVQFAPKGQAAGVELWHEEPGGPAAETSLHLAFLVDDVRGWVAHLRARGVVIAKEPFEIGREVIAFVRDPDGYLVELNETRP